MTVYYVFMTHGDPKLGPAGSAKHTDTTSPQAEMQIFLTLGRTKVYTEAVFSKGFPPFLSLFFSCSQPISQNIKLDSSFAVIFSAVTWTKLLKQNPEASLMLLCEQMVLAQTLTTTMQFVCDWL